MLLFARRALSGVAKYSISMAQPPIRSLADLVDTLKTLLPTKPDQRSLDNLSKRDQEAEESLSEYLQELIHLASKCNFPQAELIRLAIRNANQLFKPTLMCLHATRPFTSMQEMIIKARELEDLDQSKVPRLPKYLARFVEPKRNASNFDRLYCTFCRRSGHDISECRSKKREMAQANGNRPETQASVQIAIPFQDLDEEKCALTAIKRVASEQPPYKATYYRTQQRGSYSIKEDLQNCRANITFEQLMELAPTCRAEIATYSNPESVSFAKESPQSFTAVTVVANIENVEIPVVLDSGAALSLITLETAKKLNYPIETSHCTPIIGIHNTTCNSVGIVRNAHLKIAGCPTYVDLVVVSSCPTSIILGTSWFYEYGAILDFSKSQVTLSSGHKNYCAPIQVFKSLAKSQGMALHVALQNESSIIPEGLPDELFKKFEEAFQPTLETVRAETFHRIITCTSKPIKSTAYRLSPTENQFACNIIDELLKTSRISPSKSDWSSPIVLVKKKSSDLRLCVDYRKLNSVTVKDNYPLPHIDSILDHFAGCQYFSTLDLSNGYWQVPVHPDDRHKTAFICQKGLYEWNVMPFGLCNAPATFQRLMNNIFQEFVGIFLLIYIDDIIIFSKSAEEHFANIKATLEQIINVNIRLNPKKCKFFMEKVNFLGHTVSIDGIEPDPSKVIALKAIPIPKSVKQTQAFLGLANFYRRFIKNFASIAKPLHDVSKSTANFCWTTMHQDAFDRLKEALCTAPIRSYPQPEKHFVLHTEASDVALGAVLCQESDGKTHIINYNSRILNKHETNYCKIELECLALVWGIKVNRQYLALTDFEIVTKTPRTSASEESQRSQWKTFKMEFEITRLLLHHYIQTRRCKYCRCPFTIRASGYVFRKRNQRCPHRIRPRWIRSYSLPIR